MPRIEPLPPSASALSQSMRDIGYSLDTAIADLIDNSISANATNIDIVCNLANDDPVIVVIDDGHGMTDNELRDAMRHGASDKNRIRPAHDLGRFGLGLKTASFSQCRRLSVITSKDSVRSAIEWDLDLVDKEDKWVVCILDEGEISELPYIDRLEDNGTIVIWRSLDRVFEGESGNKRDEIVHEKLDVLEKHLALVFHRFLSGEVQGRKKIHISVNGHDIEPFDPFCRKNSATQLMPEDKVYINNQVVRIQPYILPHHSKLTATEYDYYQNRSDFISNQGAYIYRNGRLMAWGDWFRIISKGEATKLARVQIDFPSSLDSFWTIDIKKSRATPPHTVKDSIRNIIKNVESGATRVHRRRGKKLFEEIKSPFWERYAEQDTIRYAVNRDHPLIIRFTDSLDTERKTEFLLLLDSLATSLPIEMVYSDFSTKPKDIYQTYIPPEECEKKLHDLKSVFSNGASLDQNSFREIIDSTRMFENHQDIVDKFLNREFG